MASLLSSTDSSTVISPSINPLQPPIERFFTQDAKKHEIVPVSTVEWCLHHVFDRFVTLAESKVEVLLNQSTVRSSCN
jgi:hypothetical protein